MHKARRAHYQTFNKMWAIALFSIQMQVAFYYICKKGIPVAFNGTNKTIRSQQRWNHSLPLNKNKHE